MSRVKNIEGLEDIIHLYDIFILDQWGVMHNGKKGYKDAIKCIKFLKKKNNKLIIISNSSKRKKTTISNLPKLGFDPKHFFEVMTSGEMIWKNLKKSKYEFIKNLKKNCYHLYDKSDRQGKSFIEGLKKYNFVKKLENADFILGCTTSANLNTIDYLPLLMEAKKNNLPFLCANPDYETILYKSNKLIFCMGTLAELYKSLGGRVFILGKPKIDIYRESLKKIKNLDKSKILAIGDSMHHDILGAHNFRIDSLLITSGIHKSIFKTKNINWYSKKNILKNLKIQPTYMCDFFKL